MKSTLNQALHIILIVAMIILSSCSKKESNENNEPESYLMINGTKYSLSKGMYDVEFDSFTNNYTIYLLLYSGFTINSFDTDQSINGNGTGNYMLFYLPSDQPLIVSKNYINGGPDPSSNCEEIIGNLNLTLPNEFGEVYFESNDDGLGTINISKSNDIYEITFSFNAGNGLGDFRVTGYFKGTISLTN